MAPGKTYVLPHSFQEEQMKLEICGNLDLTVAQSIHVSTVLLNHPDLELAVYGRNRSFFATTQLAGQVLANSLPGMSAMLNRQLEPEGFAAVIGNAHGQVVLIYLEGDPTNWHVWDYLDIAIRKYKMAWRWKMNTSSVKGHMIEPGDTIFRGGVFVDGMPGAVSGFDEDQGEDTDWGMKIMYDLVEACSKSDDQWRRDSPAGTAVYS